ncbi:cell surface glycoprotein 1-like isoform X1 [Armigeres subalbatus]|uniref:cell surface glycoprotein 1-like isoform X1 n=1 Tax=Armigeres subalbatus TaxID=124917 RepID=UPI002ECFB413
MGIFLSVLVASVGAMDVINCLALLTNQLTGPPARVDQDLERYRQLLREQIDKTPKSPTEGLTYAQDGVIYKDGYRVEKFDDAKLDQLNVRIKELERKSQEKDQTLDRLNVKLQELERKSVERDLVITEIRSRSVSRRESPEPTTSRNSNSSPNIPQIILDNDEPRRGSSKFRPIHRDDEFRRTIKKRSLTSNVSDDRTDELEVLSQMEEDEANQMEDYVPLVYDRDDYPDSKMKKHMISPIQELCQMHEEEHRHMTLERSPEPSFGANITKPWGDIKLEETKGNTLIHPARDLCIQEEIRDSESSAPEEDECVAKHIEETQQWLQSTRNTFPELPQLKPDNLLPTSESVPSNLSSHSNSPDPEHPPLKRTRKKSDLTALLLEEERKAEAFTTIIIQTEESDSEGVDRTGFMQSKSPSPYVGPFVENESQQSTGQLIPLVHDPSKSPTLPDPDQQQSSVSSLPSVHSRDATISPAPIASSGSPASPVSSIVDESAKDGPYHFDGDDRASPVLSEKNVSRDGSVSLASTDASAASLDLHVDQAQPSVAPPSPPIQQLAAISVTVDVDAGGVGRKSPVSPAPTEDKQTPPRRFRSRKRVIRSVTPINFDQTFMDQFSEQQMCVSPSELEDYINSMDEIKIDPPKPVVPNYFIPTTPLTSGVPSLIVTDDKGADARFHDELSSKSFYGTNRLDPERILNHRVNYEEWLKKFPENMTSHLELEDYDSDDEEVDSIINGSKSENRSKAVSPELQTELRTFPTDVSPTLTQSPEPTKDLPSSPENSTEIIIPDREEFPLNLKPAYATPSPASEISDISLSNESAPDTSSMALGSPLLNSVPSPTAHFTPITSPMSSLKSPTPETSALSPHPFLKLQIPSRSPSRSPIPANMTPEEAIFEIGHLDGLIFETQSRSPTPSLQTPSIQLTPLSPEELAYDIGNLGGLILGPPSRSVSPLPLSPSPTPESSLSSAWTSLQAPTILSDDEIGTSDAGTRKTTTTIDTNKNS